MTISIRSFAADDLSTLVSITIEAFDGVSIDHNISRLLGGETDWKQQKALAIEFDCQRYPQGVFVAQQNEEIVGYVTTWIDSSMSTGFIPNLAVHRDHRGSGIGRQLIRHALDFFKQQRLQYARIETLDQNQVGQHLYPQLGFQEVARQIHYAIRLDLD